MDKEMNHEKNQKNFYYKDIRKIIKNRRFNFTMIKNKINKNQKEKRKIYFRKILDKKEEKENLISQTLKIKFMKNQK